MGRVEAGGAAVWKTLRLTFALRNTYRMEGGRMIEQNR